MKNKVLKLLFILILGTVIGIFSKCGDVSGIELIHYFGLLSSGVVLWLNIGTLFLIKSKSRKEFSAMYSVFMATMLVSYYLFSAFAVKYIYTKIIAFWIIVLLGSILLGNVIFSKRYTNMFGIIFIVSSVVLVIFDAIKINGIQIEVVIPEILLSVITLMLIKRNRVKIA